MAFDDIEDQQLEESKSIDDGNQKSCGRPKGLTKQLIRERKETVKIAKYRIICRYLHEMGVHYKRHSSKKAIFSEYWHNRRNILSLKMILKFLTQQPYQKSADHH